jgi:Uncharacterized conserved protein
MIQLSPLFAVMIAGFLSSWHCFAMCGGIVGVLSQGAEKQSKSERIIKWLLYNGGRITTYSIAGFIAGLIGNKALSVFSLSHAQTIGAYLSGAFIIALGLYLGKWWQGLVQIERFGMNFWQWLNPIKQRFFKSTNGFGLYVKGLIWGWLPCGLVYSMLIWSLTTGNPYQGSLMMFAFGLSTLPAIFLMAYLNQSFFQSKLSLIIKRIVSIILIIFGCAVILGLISSFVFRYHVRLVSWYWPELS